MTGQKRSKKVARVYLLQVQRGTLVSDGNHGMPNVIGLFQRKRSGVLNFHASSVLGKPIKLGMGYSKGFADLFLKLISVKRGRGI